MAVRRVLHDGKVVHALGKDHDIDAHLLGHEAGLVFAARLLWRAVAERTGKVYGDDLYALVYHELDSERAVKTTREERNGLFVHIFTLLWRRSRQQARIIPELLF